MGLATSKIRSMAMGLVELAGVAEKAHPLKDPIYQQECAYFKVKVEEERGSGKHRRWVTIFNVDSSAVPFYVKDSTGKALVMPNGADLHRTPTVQCTSGGISILGGAPDLAVQNFLGRIKTFGRSVRLVAHVIRDNDPVFILGYVAPLPSTSFSVTVTQAEAAEKIKASPAMSASLDANNDGQVDAMEWETGIKAIKKQMEEARMKEELNKPVEKKAPPPPIVNKSPDGIMIIGTDEDDIVRKLGWKSLFQVIGGPVMVIAGIYILQLFLGR